MTPLSATSCSRASTVALLLAVLVYGLFFNTNNTGYLQLFTNSSLQQSGQVIALPNSGELLVTRNSNSTSRATIPPALPFKYKLCLITKIRNMPKLLAEWLEYHTLIGVEQVFLADDCSDDNGQTRLVLELYERAGLVTGYTKLPFNDCVNRRPNGERLYSHVVKDAKEQCEWIGAMDVDEYLTLQEDLYSGTLHSLLDESILPVIRMPWVLMGSDGHETAPPGLVIEGFANAGPTGPMIKTLVKSNIIVDWEFSHWPVISSPSERMPPPSQAELDFLNSTKYAGSDYPLEAWMTQLWVCPEEKRTVDVDGQQCSWPVGALFMKHYKWLSWQQFMEYRGKRATDAAEGNPEPDQDKRIRWQEGNFTAGACASIASNFTLAMAAKVKAGMASRTGPWLEPFLQTYEGVIR